MNCSENVSEARVRINTLVVGEPAQWLGEWKRRGLITSYTDGILQALKLYNEKQAAQDLKKAQIANLTQYDP